MPQSDPCELIDVLPWALRRDTTRYVAAVRENAGELFRQAQVRLTPERVDQLLLLAVVQKLWATVNAQAWIVDSSLGLIQEASESEGSVVGAAGLRVGRAMYSRGSPRYVELHRLQADLDQTLRRLEIRDLVRNSSLLDLIRSLDEREPHGR